MAPREIRPHDAIALLGVHIDGVSVKFTFDEGPGFSVEHIKVFLRPVDE